MAKDSPAGDSATPPAIPPHSTRRTSSYPLSTALQNLLQHTTPTVSTPLPSRTSRILGFSPGLPQSKFFAPLYSPALCNLLEDTSHIQVSSTTKRLRAALGLRLSNCG